MTGAEEEFFELLNKGKMTNLQQITKIIQEANPESNINCCYWCYEKETEKCLEPVCRCHRLTLEHVFVALESRSRDDLRKTKREVEFLSNYQEALWSTSKDLIHMWQLTKPLEDQSPETIIFLLDILKDHE